MVRLWPTVGGGSALGILPQCLEIFNLQCKKTRQAAGFYLQIESDLESRKFAFDRHVIQPDIVGQAVAEGWVIFTLNQG